MATRIFNPDRTKSLSLKKTTAGLTYAEMPNGKKHFYLTTAITSGATAHSTGAATGDWAETTHATGRGKLFYSNGTNWILINT